MAMNGNTSAIVQRLQRDMESIADGIHEELCNAARNEIPADRLSAFERIASLSKRLRSACNRTALELRRTIINPTK